MTGLIVVIFAGGVLSAVSILAVRSCAPIAAGARRCLDAAAIE